MYHDSLPKSIAVNLYGFYFLSRFIHSSPMEFHYGISNSPSPLPLFSPHNQFALCVFVCVWAFNISLGSLFAMISLLIIRIAEKKSDL